MLGCQPAAQIAEASVAAVGLDVRSRFTGRRGDGEGREGVAFLPFVAGQPQGFEDFVTGFLSADGTSTFGRPAGVTVAADGALLFSDDTNGIVYRVQSD